jgi:deoxyribonuclease (pyrimidine dimer)
MVRINLVPPNSLSNQHLIAEYNEILMFFGHVKKYPKISFMPKHYVLGKGHINFFKNKLLYLKKRHELIKKEMHRRGFRASKTIHLSKYPKHLCKGWSAKKSDFAIIKKTPCAKACKKSRDIIRSLPDNQTAPSAPTP